jgi:hypothetical protein
MLPTTILIVLVIVLVLLGAVLRSRLGGGPPKLPYAAREYLLSRSEAAFYHSLKKAVGDSCPLSMKVRLSDVLICPREAMRAGYGNRIAQKHLEFVLCDPNSMKILAAVEVYDASHRRTDRVNRDEFLDRAMSAAGVPLLRFPASRQYDVASLAQNIARAVDPRRPG